MTAKRSAIVRYLFSLAGKENPLVVREISTEQALHGAEPRIFNFILWVLGLPEEQLVPDRIAHAFLRQSRGWPKSAVTGLRADIDEITADLSDLEIDAEPLPSLRLISPAEQEEWAQWSLDTASRAWPQLPLVRRAFEFPAAQNGWRQVFQSICETAIVAIYAGLPVDAMPSYRMCPEWFAALPPFSIPGAVVGEMVWIGASRDWLIDASRADHPVATGSRLVAAIADCAPGFISNP